MSIIPQWPENRFLVAADIGGLIYLQIDQNYAISQIQNLSGFYMGVEYNPNNASLFLASYYKQAINLFSV
jgi:hypothetical protein